MNLKILKKEFSRYFVLLLLTVFMISCTTTYNVNKVQESYLRIDPKLENTASKSMDSLINPYKMSLDNIMNEVIGYSDGLSMSKPESTLGNWVADALEKNAEQIAGMNIAFAAQNYGGLRIKEITEGPVSLSKIYELMPFDNYLTILTVDGRVLGEFIDRIAKYGGWPVSSSLKFRIENDIAIDISIDNIPLDPDSSYLIALPDYIANGGDDCFFFDSVPKNYTGYLIRDILINEVKNSTAKNEHIKAKIEGRIR